jgi:ornithine cyclodeaminase/alanine dehydrogenase-like protein (mu-crystallin family)
MAAAVTAMKAAYAELSTGQAHVPLRVALPVPPAGAVALFMPAYLPSSGLGAKIVSVFPRNSQLGKAVINGLVVVLDPSTGEPLALLDGTFLTAWRTAAGAAAGVDVLARPDARVGALLGCGAQGRTLVVAMDCVRRLETIRVYAPTPARVEAFIAQMQPEVSARLLAAGSANAAVDGADVIGTATTSATPVFDGGLLKPGAHVSGVGSYTLEMQEVDAVTVSRARIFIDSREPALAEAGDLVIPLRAGLTRAEDWTELGEVVAGLKPGRQSPDDITFFKSVGNAAQDIAAAGKALAEARRLGLGQEVEF